MRLSLLLCLLSAVVAWCQKPVISSVVNAASYQPANTSSQLGIGVAGGSLTSIFGANLATCTQTATTTPLPTQICGTYVGCGYPLLYVSPDQINFQWPTAASLACALPIPPGTPSNSIIVTTPAGASDPYKLGPSADGDSWFGIFTADSSGCGQGAVLNDSADGNLSVNSRSNSVSPGDYISIFGTGLFIPSYTPGFPPDGSPAPSSPLVAGQCAASIVDLHYSPTNFACWSGLAPGLIGVNQINAQVPATAREGCAVPLELHAAGNAISQPVTISIRKGGGPCVDPPSAGYGQITWEKTITTAASGSTSETDTMTVSLQASPGRQAPPPPVYAATSPGSYFEISYFGPSCTVPGYRSLEAGVITADGPGFPPAQAAVVPIPLDLVGAASEGQGGVFLEQGQVKGLTVYRASLPAGTIQPGSFKVNVSGAADVGAFQSSVQIGSGIQVTTPVAGKTFPSNQPLTIHWTGGDPGTWVTFRLVRHLGTSDYNSVVQARASDGTVTLGLVGSTTIASHPTLPGPYVANMDIVLEVSPDPSQIPAFSAPGLSLGGQHTWKYIYRFEGVTIQ